MFKNRKMQLFGALVLIAAAVLVTLSSVKPPASEIDSATRSYIAWGYALKAANEEGAKPPAYMLGASAYEANQKGLAIYAQSEHVLAYPTKENEAGLTIYHQSEWFGE